MFKKKPNTIQEILERVNVADYDSPITVFAESVEGDYMAQVYLYAYFTKTIETNRMKAMSDKSDAIEYVGDFHRSMDAHTVEKKLFEVMGYLQ